MFPGAGNTLLNLLSVMKKTDEIGNITFQIIRNKEVIGILRSVTSTEYQTSVMMNLNIDLKVKIQAFLYDGSQYAQIKERIYKIERTYMEGQFIELYLSLTDLKGEDLR